MNSNRIARLFYNLISPIYDFFFGSDTRYVRDMRARIVERLDLKKGYSVLEVAVGTGANLPCIFKKIGKSGRIFGLDISQGMLEQCKQNLKKKSIRAELVLGNAEELPYKDNAFDAVLGFGAINFLDKRKAILEMVRVAKPGSKIVMGDEIFPFIGTPDSARRYLPKNVSEVRQSIERVLIPFWIIEFRKKRKGK